MLQSLQRFGRYGGAVLIVTDKASNQIRIPEEIRERTQIVHHDAPGLMTRYQIYDFIGACDVPVLHMDTDIIVTQQIEPILRKMERKGGIFACSEANLYPALAKTPASAITERFANFFGLELFLADMELRNHPLLCLNSGMFGFSRRDAFEAASRRIEASYNDKSWSVLASHYNDQPFFNYVMAKSGANTEILDGTLSLVRDAEAAAELRREFVHFLWAKPEDKAGQMFKFMDFLVTHGH
jgi:hypothetical protein